MIFELLILFQLKHFIADYPLQGKYMLGKFKYGLAFVGPLSAHCLVHAALTAAICLYFAPHFALSLAALDFAVHFIVDRIKASPALLGRFRYHQRQFWWALGADQMLHHLTHYFIIAEIMSQ